MSKSILWFRNDLRIHDNVALHLAIKQSSSVLPVYCIDPRQFKNTSLGFPKTGAFRAQFLLESLEDLRNNLQKAGSNLLVMIGFPEEIIPVLCDTHNITDVYASKETTSEEISVEVALEKKLWQKQIAFHLEWQSTLYHIEDIPWPIRNLPDVFTHFRKECEREAEIRPTVPTPKNINSPSIPEWGDIPTLGQLGLAPAQMDERAAIKFKGGENAGLQRLKDYFWKRNKLKEYKETRNGLIGEDYSSKFSPWLAHGCLSPRYIYEEIKSYEKNIVKNQSTYWLIFELIWRDYFRMVCKKYENAVFKIGGIRSEKPHFSHDQERFQCWIDGTTGVPFIDANMRELKNTGFMSNRGRQNVASFLVKDLEIDWRWGARWFESQLIDYDVCSNWGNWNYVAGIGNDPRENRYFNILSQASRYDSRGNYVRIWLPELAAIPGGKIHQPSELPHFELREYGIQLGHHYPAPVVDFKRWLVG